MRSAYIKRKSRYFSIPALNAIPKVQKEPMRMHTLFFSVFSLAFCSYGNECPAAR